jgi:hypothetical protein
MATRRPGADPDQRDLDQGSPGHAAERNQLGLLGSRLISRRLPEGIQIDLVGRQAIAGGGGERRRLQVGQQAGQGVAAELA